MNSASPLVFSNFESDENPLYHIQQSDNSPQSKYVYKYLERLGATKVIVENSYFDRDYLDEFSAFYSKSAKGYRNVCKRVHFFSSEEVNRELFVLANSGDIFALKKLNNTYLGFSVIRPITTSPFGRTVLCWYEDQMPETPRVTEPSRDYVCNVAGIQLKVYGIAWQQQDTGIAACATIGIWSMLHSSAFDAHHYIPTTRMITEAAHTSGSVGHRTYPSYSLTHIQIQHAINELGFSPSLTFGELPGPFFSKSRFANTCAAYLRSGYPVLIIGQHPVNNGVGHAICAVGFRESAPTDELEPGKVYLQDDRTDYIYIHDDNIGPNVRFKIDSEAYTPVGSDSQLTRCILKMQAPERFNGDQEPSLDNTHFIPSAVIVAVHDDLKTSSDLFFQNGIQLSNQLANAINATLKQIGFEPKAIVVSTRFIMLKDFLQTELSRQLTHQPELLSSVRMQLQEDVPPMSLHLAILRIALPDSSLILDVIFDTTDTDRNRTVFCHIVYDETTEKVLAALNVEERHKVLGCSIRAF